MKSGRMTLYIAALLIVLTAVFSWSAAVQQSATLPHTAEPGIVSASQFHVVGEDNLPVFILSTREERPGTAILSDSEGNRLAILTSGSVQAMMQTPARVAALAESLETTNLAMQITRQSLNDLGQRIGGIEAGRFHSTDLRDLIRQLEDLQRQINVIARERDRLNSSLMRSERKITDLEDRIHRLERGGR